MVHGMKRAAYLPAPHFKDLYQHIAAAAEHYNTLLQREGEPVSTTQPSMFIKIHAVLCWVISVGRNGGLAEHTHIRPQYERREDWSLEDLVFYVVFTKQSHLRAAANG